MSFLKQAYALEQEVLEEVTDVDGDDFLDTTEQATAARYQVETVGEEIERAIIVHDEIENQNETLEEIIKEKGEITPEVAAMTEVARRTAAAGLGLNPDEEGKELVDSAGLESMVSGAVVLSMEAAKEQSKSLWEKIKQLWNVFVEKVYSFWNWLVKLFDGYGRRCKALANKLRTMDKETFNANLIQINNQLTASWNKTVKENGIDNSYNGREFTKTELSMVIDGGKLIDVKQFTEKAFKLLGEVNKEVDESTKEALKGEELEFGKILSSRFKTTAINTANVHYVFGVKDNAIVFDTDNDFSNFQNSYHFSFSKEELMTILLQADKIKTTLRNYSAESFKRYKAAKDQLNNSVLSKDQKYNGLLKDILKSRKSVFSGEMGITRRLTTVMKFYVKVATQITTITKK